MGGGLEACLAGHFDKAQWLMKGRRERRQRGFCNSSLCVRVDGRDPLAENGNPRGRAG